ncbi:hypothetical protein EPUS_05752 [Endocarpon pusillum Z07020]|uniref:Uncharacterized protein n=1 Tax=Endocarpon pusillum (strain Z07020 / HMAS-L-300199) TaxID=1263415 RepID=U1GAJ3_ENDPU|nr:uncharacterized protein EPUS_05752 [Endocarpon pusillum Z07020]ERF68691.1 hypothetical protein EPUS_05752 [Endocarpon pusillum Z07020]
MSYFYTSPTSNIPPQPHRSAIRMTRTGSSSSTTSTASNSSSISIPSPYNSSSQPGSSSASFSSSYWPSSSSTTCSSPSSYANRHSHSRHNSNGTSYLPTPFRSALLHSSSVASSSSSSHNPHSEPSSYFSDDELLSLNLESVHLDGTSTVPNRKREMTTEEQVAAVREQVEREREAGKNDAWWLQGVPAQQAPVMGMEKRSRVVRFAGETRKTSGHGKRRSVVVGGKGSSRRD